ncbi:MAG: DUF6883 domain-containing protein [Hyphomicrobiaceae bacterium]
MSFTNGAPEILRQALLDHAAANDVRLTRDTPFGIVFEVNGPLVAPDGRAPFVLIVWMIDSGAQHPRLVTAIPSKEDAT